MITTKSILTSKTAKDFVIKTLDSAIEKVSNNVKQTIQNKIVEYTVETARKCSFLKTILHKENIAIDKIYFPLRLKSEYEIIVPKKAKDLFKSCNCIVIEGKGGSGKTTFIKNFYINSVKSNYKIPILLNLRDFNFIDISENKKKKEIINNLFYKEVVSYLVFNKVGINAEVIIQMFDSGSFLFILDGYDELSYEINSYILKDIEDFIIRFPKNSYLITTRPYTNVTRLSGFINYSICGLNEETEIEPFVSQQLYKNKELAESIVDSLKAESSRKYIPLLANPLFLVLFINSFESYPKLPPQKSTFYWQVFDALFEKHETYSKSGYRRPKLSKLTREEFEFVLNSFSFVSYFQSQFTFKQIYLEKVLREIKKAYEKSFELTDFIEDLKVTLSILVEDGNEFSFIHRTLQEYFTARYLSFLSEKDKHSFFHKLSYKQVRESSHTFLIELLSELYVNEYNQYYLAEHLKALFDLKEDIFISTHLKHDECVNALKVFSNFFEVLSFSKDMLELFTRLIERKSNSYDLGNKILVVASEPSLHQIAKKMLILYRNKFELFEEIENYYKHLSSINKPFIDFALYTSK